ncbi:MAG: hypothetical protein KGN80_09520 [Acidobacteriota bacterium]|nr:hypothetical protein [Acidobacteriota bacterium]
MMQSRFRSALRSPFAATAAITLLVMAPGCDKFRKKSEDKEIQKLEEKAAELDKLSQKQQQAAGAQDEKLKQAGVTDIKPNAETMQLTDEQKKALEERIKTEKNSSYQALLQEVLNKDKEIKELNDKVAKLRAVLPKPDMAGPNDSHYGMALRFLKKKGVPLDQARALVSRVNLMEKMAPGFEVYHFYSNGVYGTWVNQGKAKISPSDLQRQEREKIENERDTAVAQGEKLQEEVDDLATRKKQLESDISGLTDEKAKLQTAVAELTTTSEKQKALLNSLHYVVGTSKKLVEQGVIIVPVFAKDRAGKNWRDDVFDKALDLRSADTITISASDLGLKKISKVSVVPGSLVKDQHYKLTISDDKLNAVVKLLAKDRFRNEKVVFAVSE